MKSDSEALAVFAPDLFAGKTALVTGGGRGIGKRIALAFARLGSQVVIAGRNAETLTAAGEEIAGIGARCVALTVNIREVEQVEDLLSKALRKFGVIDFLVNNAGGQFPARPTEITDGGWRAVVDLNLNGTWNMCSRVGPLMAATGFGSIVNIVHIYALERGAPPFAHSGAARAGVVNLTKTLACHYARKKVRVNAVAPGFVDTSGLREHEFKPLQRKDFESTALRDVPAGRFADPDEVAAITLFLCSPAAAYITGTTIVADGALSLGNWTPWMEPEP
ncbi:MAG: SDR family oxidoreductase [Candidatus Latescibacteria bacterium]|nr:SDR family oxidoreductase [Candidatus Latescibacterota bacterium]